VNGVFNIELGTITPLNEGHFNPDIVLLETVIDGSPLEPMRKLGATPYAFRANVVESGAGDDGGMRLSFIDVNCECVGPVADTFVKIGDMGTFTKAEEQTDIELNYSGRVKSDGWSGSTGVYFELRIDDQPPSDGRALAVNGQENVSANVTIIGVYSGLATGSHTASMWARTYWGSVTQACFEPGCWNADQLLVREYMRD